MTKLTETIIAIVVPRDAEKYFVSRAHGDNDLVYIDKEGKIKYVTSLPSGKWSIVGLAWWNGKLECDFDAEKFCKVEIGFVSDLGNKEIIASLLQSKGLYWVNEIERPDIANSFVSQKEYDQEEAAWQAAQSKCLKPEQKVLILKHES